MVAKVHNVLVLHFDVYELSKIQKENLLESNWDFLEICPPTVFRDRQFDPPKTMSIEDEIAYKVVGHFHSFYLSPRTAQSEFVCDLWTHFTGGQI